MTCPTGVLEAIRIEAMRNEQVDGVEDVAVQVAAPREVQAAEAGLDRPQVHAGDVESVDHLPPLQAGAVA